MKKIEFVKRLVGLIVAPLILPTSNLCSVTLQQASSPEKQKHEIYAVEVAGVFHYEATNVYHEMKLGDLLELVREPQNDFDRKAIAIYFNPNSALDAKPTKCLVIPKICGGLTSIKSKIFVDS